MKTNEEYMKLFVGKHLEDDSWYDCELIEDNEDRTSIVADFSDIRIVVDSIQTKFDMIFENVSVKFILDKKTGDKMCNINVTNDDKTKSYFRYYTNLNTTIISNDYE